MNFIVGDYSRVGTPNTCLLVPDAWDDWFSFRTMFGLFFFDHSGQPHHIGSVKIGHQGLTGSGSVSPGHRAPALQPNFNQLPEGFFSLGQSDNYYESLNELGPEIRDEIHTGLRDCAHELTTFERFRDESVMRSSLLRSISESQVLHRFNRLAHGNVALSDFNFTYTFADTQPPQITFKVTPASEPPTNVHVLIGRNGVGKTRCLTNLVNSILDPDSTAEGDGKISAVISDRQETSFSGVVVVSFSAFDEFRLPERIRNGIHAHHIGIPAVRPQTAAANEDAHATTFNDAFMQSFERCMSGLRRRRILDAVVTLENDPLFAEANLSGLLNEGPGDAAQSATELFKRMSSGHKIILLTVTRLVELVDERTLVLLDEPEGHLHPPLLSAFVRALSDLLIKRNGVALISTHSPVVLQEVPKSCVWVLWRSGRESRVSRPEIETFGENVGILTREIFGLEVTNSGFHQMLRTATSLPEATFESVMEKFGNQLGAEAQAIVRSLLAIKANGERR